MNVLRFALPGVAMVALLTSPGLARAFQGESSNTVPSVAPRVPPAAGKPCVVELLHERLFPQSSALQDIDPNIYYTPPAACPPPWAKVVIKVDITESRHSIVNTLNIDLNSIPLFSGQSPRFGGDLRWYVERDLTDYSALLRHPQTGLLWTASNEGDFDTDDVAAFTGNATLVFYPPTAKTPAPKVPDRVYPISAGAVRTLPRNIVRAYLDVYNQGPWWYTCVTNEAMAQHRQLSNVFAPGDVPKQSIANQEQGCGGGSFREMQVTVDNMPAGIAPVFPLLPADLNMYFINSLDQPVPTIQMPIFTPYRVDLTPFAGILDRSGLHQIGAGGALLVYLDHGRSQVSGAVTRNTLDLSHGAPIVADSLVESGLVLRGKLITTQQRDFDIGGYVDTSRGRIQSEVHQRSTFRNEQSFHVEGPADPESGVHHELYEQGIVLSSLTERTSQRRHHGKLLGYDRERVGYPLRLGYRMDETIEKFEGEPGWSLYLNDGTATVVQHRRVEGDHYRAGKGHYLTRFDEGYTGSHTRFENPDPPPYSQVDSNWRTQAYLSYSDNFGSCYKATVSQTQGNVSAPVKGAGCPGNRNHVRWFARPDGSPVSLGWWQ